MVKRRFDRDFSSSLVEQLGFSRDNMEKRWRNTGVFFVSSNENVRAKLSVFDPTIVLDSFLLFSGDSLSQFRFARELLALDYAIISELAESSTGFHTSMQTAAIDYVSVI